jgi:hypothetical protein
VDYGSVDTILESTAPISDEELSAIALAAEPITLDANAVPWGGGDARTPSLLPNWYMPSPSYHVRGRWTRAIVITLIVGFLVIDAFGLCITSGFISFA